MAKHCDNECGESGDGSTNGVKCNFLSELLHRPQPQVEKETIQRAEEANEDEQEPFRCHCKLK